MAISVQLYNKVSTAGFLTPEARKHSSALRAIWRSHVQSTLRRGKKNQITVDEFAMLIKMDCHYCGSPPRNMTKHYRAGNFAYNGLDRVDNDRPYNMTNLVACCKLCNAMKSQLGAEEFVAHIMRVSQFQKQQNRPRHVRLLFDCEKSKSANDAE